MPTTKVVATILHPRHFSIFLVGNRFNINLKKTCFLDVPKNRAIPPKYPFKWGDWENDESPVKLAV
jgi:hypothetical protein